MEELLGKLIVELMKEFDSHELLIERVDPFENYIGIGRDGTQLSSVAQFRIFRITFDGTSIKVNSNRGFSKSWDNRAVIDADFPALSKPLFIDSVEVSVASQTTGVELLTGNVPLRNKLIIVNIGNKKLHILPKSTKSSGDKGRELGLGDSITIEASNYEKYYVYVQSGGTGSVYIEETL